MNDWKEYNLEEIAFINPSESIKKGTIAKKIPMEFLEPFSKKVKKYSLENFNGGVKFKNGDTIIARITPSLENGKTAFIDLLDESEVGFGSTEFIVLREKTDVSNKHYLFYLAISPEFRDIAILSMTGSTGRQRVQIEVVKNHSFLLPPLPEQKAIAEVLSSLDDKIDLLHRQNETLEKMAETLFRQWFIEEAKDDWEEKTFSTLIEETLGGEWGKEIPENEYLQPVLCFRGTDIADLNSGLPLKIPLRYVKEKKFNSIKPREGDILLEISGGTENQSTGRVTYINSDIENLFKHPIVFSNFCRLIRVKHNEYSFFLYLYFKYLYDQDEFFNLENGSSGIKNLNYKALINELKYRIPETDIIKDFHYKVERYFKKINKNKLQIQTLTKLRDTLLPKLMSGEVRVNYN